MKDLIGDKVYLPGQNGEDDKPMPVDPETEPALQASLPDRELLKYNPILEGLDIPSQKKGQFSDVDEERWLVVVEELMTRGAKTSGEIAGLVGVSQRRIATFIKLVKERWAKSMTPGQVNTRREALYLEAERVKDACWLVIQNTDNDMCRLAYLKMILEAGKRQSSLIGAEKQQVAIEHSVEARHKTPDEMQGEIASSLNISAEDYASLGNLLAEKLTEAKKLESDND
jgi:hypothetical protein